jgi:hypothetical protein
LYFYKEPIKNHYSPKAYTFAALLKTLNFSKTFYQKMPCGYCSGIGHTMRNCNSSAAESLLFNYRRECLIPRTDEELNRFLRSFTGDMLSLIMYSYGASSVSVNRPAKEQFIRERILQARGQSVPVPVPVPVLVQPAILQPAILQPARVTVQRETMIAYKARMQVVANTLFDVICVTAYGITQYTDANSVQFRQMLNLLSECLIAQTGNSMSESAFISKLIIKQFHLRRVIAPVIKNLFFNSIYTEHRRVNEIRINQMRAQGLLPPAPIHRPQVFVPHRPKFADIQLVHNEASEAEDYCCGICSDEFTKETLPTLGCRHTLCVECITGQIKARTKSCIRCPYCREEVTQISVGDEVIRNQIYTVVTAEIAKN